jgi:lipopolysaccharide export system protein LptA
MTDLRYTSIFLIIFLSFMLPAAGLPEEDSQNEAGKVDAGAMVIKSQSLEVDNMRKIVVFTGQVDARRDDLIINCQKMLVYYNRQPTSRGSGNADVKIDKIVATGKVKISRPDGGLAMAEKAIYYENDEKVVLTGKPVVKQGNDFVEGSKITLYLREERSVVEGSEDKKVRAVLHPKSEKR